ncbi:MAG: hypothetical protein KDK50_06325, partial [Chlamydiia bacterium]|nr:hypothetical protein [Chlamydiia bacterium]
YDHHKTALALSEKLGWGCFDLKESGASLTWKQEFPEQELPKILAYVRDKDLFDWKLPHSRELSMYLRHCDGITNPTSKIWKRLLDGVSEQEWKDMIAEGKRLLQFQQKTLQMGLKNAFPLNFHGHKTLAVNWNLEASDLGEMIYTEKGYDIAMIFYYTGKEWNFSLRSKDVDVSRIAQKYGGGGHPGAAGFRTDSFDFIRSLQRQQQRQQVQPSQANEEKQTKQSKECNQMNN